MNDFDGAFDDIVPTKRKRKRRAHRGAIDGRNGEPEPTLNEAVDDPDRLARLFIGSRMHHHGPIVRFWRDEFHVWNGSAYRVLPTIELTSMLCAFIREEFEHVHTRELEAWKQSQEGREPVMRKVTRALVSNVQLAIQAKLLISGNVDQPSWIGEGSFPPHEILACSNGLVHLPLVADGKGYMIEPTPRFFSSAATDFPFVAQVEPPKQWLKFLSELWLEDPQSIELLQEFMGYCLTADTRQHKILLIVGPPRSGKGTIGRIIRGIIGEGNIAGPTLSSLSTNFGLWPLLGKSVAMIQDARLSGRTDSAVVIERLLSISGEDALTIDRKNMAPVTVKLPTRFVVFTNELPRLPDSSGAIAKRFLVLQLTRSWLGDEDTMLSDRLLRECPGILHWAIGGYLRLRTRGHFIQPASGDELIRDLDDLTSPVKAFVREECILSPALETAIGIVFDRWKAWCEENGRREHGTIHVFGRDLKAAVPDLGTSQPRDREGKRFRAYRGIGLKP